MAEKDICAPIIDPLLFMNFNSTTYSTMFYCFNPFLCSKSKKMQLSSTLKVHKCTACDGNSGQNPGTPYPRLASVNRKLVHRTYNYWAPCFSWILIIEWFVLPHLRVEKTRKKYKTGALRKDGRVYFVCRLRDGEGGRQSKPRQPRLQAQALRHANSKCTLQGSSRVEDRGVVSTGPLARGHLIWPPGHLLLNSTGPDWPPKSKAYLFKKIIN